MQLLLLIGELLLLFMLSKILTVSLSALSYRIIKSKKAMVYLLALIFFPGTLIHELSHFIMAFLLRVPTGNMHLLPILEGKSIKMGSVQVARTGFLRSIIIGVAPFLTGSLLIIAVLSSIRSSYQHLPFWILILLIYGLFVIGNTMFASKKDLEGAFTLVLLLSFVFLLLSLFGVDMHLLIREATSPHLESFYQQLQLYFLVPLGIDAVTIVLLRALLALLR